MLTVASQNKLEPTRATKDNPQATSNKWNKAKPSPLRLISDTGRHSMALADIQWLACN